MKKTILSMLILGSSCAVFAQDTTSRSTGDTTSSMNTTTNGSMNNGTNSHMNNNSSSWNKDSMSNGTMSTTGAYNAYGLTSANVPQNIQGYFTRDYPAAGSNVMWMQNGDWYRASYNTNGRYSHVMYNDRGDNFTVALPVTQSYVPDDIINKLSSQYGPAIYDVTTIKSSDSTNIYQVRTIENGQVKSSWIAEDGSMVADPFRKDEVIMDANNGMNMNSGSNSNMNTNSNSNMNSGSGSN
ncbi:MAG TPA: hypothetical protein VHK91_02350, partial [Flavisolibacter sp.]|nr:hypothetical protein [Flavisolibacter sp.]